MPHIHTEPGQHDLTASAFLVRTDTPEPTVMLHKHNRLKRLMHFGGHVELDENPWQTIAHEFKEEAGYDISSLDILQPKTRVKSLPKVVQHPIPIATFTTEDGSESNHYHTDICYAFVTDKEPYKKPDIGEQQNLILLTKSELENLPADTMFDSTQEAARIVLGTLLDEWERIPADTFSL